MVDAFFVFTSIGLFVKSLPILIMRKKRIIDIGYGKKTLYELCRHTNISRRHQYGLAQLEDKYIISHVSLEHQGFTGTLKNNLKVMGSYDVVFMSYCIIPH